MGARGPWRPGLSPLTAVAADRASTPPLSGPRTPRRVGQRLAGIERAGDRRQALRGGLGCWPVGVQAEVVERGVQGGEARALSFGDGQRVLHGRRRIGGEARPVQTFGPQAVRVAVEAAPAGLVGVGQAGEDSGGAAEHVISSREVLGRHGEQVGMAKASMIRRNPQRFLTLCQPVCVPLES